jgi:ethanolamine permease
MIALFALRRREPELPRPFRAVGYPLLPATALALAAVCLGALAWYHPLIGAVFGGLVALGFGYFAAIRLRSTAGRMPPLR